MSSSIHRERMRFLRHRILRAEELLKARLQPYLADETLLLVTHRMSLLSLVNHLIVVDGGQIVAFGLKEQVIQALSSGQVRMSNN